MKGRLSTGPTPVSQARSGLAPNVAAASMRRGSTDRMAGSTVRTTNGRATRAWPTGSSHHDARQSKGRVSNVISRPSPTVTADVAMGRATAVSMNVDHDPAIEMATAAIAPTTTARTTATIIAWSDARSDATGLTPIEIPGRSSTSPRWVQAVNE